MKNGVFRGKNCEIEDLGDNDQNEADQRKKSYNFEFNFEFSDF